MKLPINCQWIIARTRGNMQFKKVKKEIINCKKRDFAQTCRFYAKNKSFSANREKCCAKVNPDAQVLISLKFRFVIFVI